MSTHVIGFVPPDEQWNKMKAAYDACVSAKVPMPKEVSSFFGHTKPDPSGAEVSIKDATREWSDVGRSGIEVEIAKIPSHVKVLRFYNSW